MKKILYIIFLLITYQLFGATYYVATNGNDSNPGTLAQPWLTWGKGFSTPVAGDTVFFRGGTYYHTVTTGAGYTTIKSGSAGNNIVYINYPDETPVLNCSNVHPTSTYNYAWNDDVSYAVFKGLHVCNLMQGSNTVEVVATRHFGLVNVTYENCKIYNVGGIAFQSWAPDSLYYINCDAWNCCDTFGLGAGTPGNRGTGFAIVNGNDTTSTVFYRGCRAWACADQGFSCYSNGYAEWDSCWSFLNGRMQGGGNGYKIGYPPSGVDYAVKMRKMTNCLGFYNRFSGLNTNDNNRPAAKCEIYNNVFYKNFDFSNDYPSASRGIVIYNTSSSDADEQKRIFRNNVSYANTVYSGDLNISVSTNALYTHSNNSWDASPSVTVTDADFLSVDSTGITGARQANGTLPVLNFLKLAASSDLIDAGTDVGLDYIGSAPDLGYDEYYVGGQDYDDWYIDPDGNDDTGDGGIDKPWATLGKATTEVTEAGDVIHVNAGSYTVAATCSLAVEVSIVGAGKATPTINSTITDSNVPALLLSSTDEGTDGNQSISGLTFDGGDTADVCIQVLRRDNVHIHDCTFSNFFSRGITFYGTESNHNHAPTTYMTGAKFYNNIVHDCSDYYGSDKVSGDGRGALNIGGTKDMEVYNNTFTQDARGTANNGYLIKFSGNGYNAGLKIHNNTITKQPYDVDSWNFAVELWTQRGGIEFYNNTVRGALDLGGYDTNDSLNYGFAAKIYNNTFYTDTSRVYPYIENGIVLERNSSGGLYIYNNAFNNLAIPIILQPFESGDGDEMEDIYIYYNLMNNVGCKDGGGVYGVGIWPVSVLNQAGIDCEIRNLNIYNNTIYQGTGNATVGIKTGFYDDSDRANTLIGCRIKNNIVQGFSYCLYADGGTIDTINVENNIFYANGNSNNPYWTGATVTNKTEQNNIKSDPLYKSATDFRLQPTSPAINAGLNVSLTTDKDGYYVRGLPDIGAYEQKKLKLKIGGKFVKNAGKYVFINY